MTDILIFSVAFACLAVINLYRLIKGPTGADRMVAGDAADALLSALLRDDPVLDLLGKRRVS